jgi:glycosyltransferase involved in cell wall biosynthesis
MQRVTFQESAKRAFTGLARAAWRALPLSPQQRGRLAARLFATAPKLFGWSDVFKRWQAEHDIVDDLAAPAIDASLDGYVPLVATAPPRETIARAIAFYLPQFHPIPENDAWWGEGFTEWTKVRAAQPRFASHDQPRMPGELGYYDLAADPDVMHRQAELAKLHGVSGFCFYFYWFAGKRLLETPIQNFHQNSSIGFPFCLCWANENWTRRWDGKDREILIAQAHSAEDDVAFIAHVSQYFANPNYIRIDGRPLLLVYRPALLPNARETADRWRTWLRTNGIGEIYLAYTQSFEKDDPKHYGFDAAVEFPPNNLGLRPEPKLVADMADGADLMIYDWRRLPSRTRKRATPKYRLFRGVTPQWDNTPRRPNVGAVFVNTAPSAYKAWLSEAVQATAQQATTPDERLVFINAWNEWAEGAYLEPDARHGYAWLEATRQALDADAQRKIIIVTHDLHKHGAQYIALNLARTLKRQFGFEVACVSGGGPGALAADFEREGPLTILDREASDASVETALGALTERGFRHAIVNSAASGWLAPVLAQLNVRMIGLVHEMPQILADMHLHDDLRAMDQLCETLVFPADAVRDRVREALQIAAWRNAHVLPQGLYKAGVLRDDDAKREARTRLVKRLRLPADARIALGVGYGDARKGVDIFAAWAKAAARQWPDLHFVWVGKRSPDLEHQRGENLHFPGFAEDTSDYFAAADIYALTSREDPFPSTALEALAARTPVILVRGTGGIESLSEHGCVQAIADAEAATFMTAAEAWLDDATQIAAAGAAGSALMHERFGFSTYAGGLLDLLNVQTPRVSVVVPNYNYAHHLEQRLESILAQTLAPREIIFLDDASTDDSVAVAERVLARAPINWRIVRNAKNSGSVFAQWRRGAEMAQGDVIWIAEADDWADPHFLEATTTAFQRRDVVLSMTQSRQVSSDGHLLAPDYLDYVHDVAAHKWKRAFVGDGPTEVRDGLSIKNTIPNASAVVFRRAALLDALRSHETEISGYRVAGDWCVYVNALRHGALAFTPTALNNHRRHDASVTISRFGLAELAEIARMQAYVAREFAPADEIAPRARAYLEALVEQFGLRGRFSAAEIAAAMDGRG